MNNSGCQSVITLKDVPEEYRAVCRAIGMQKALELARAVGGEQVYVPKIDSLVRGVKYGTIKKEFNGANYRDLAQKYGYTERWIRNILNDKA